MLELHHVLVLHGPVDLDLAHQLLLRAALRQGRLQDHLGRVDGARLLARELVALRETALAQELALDVAPHLRLSVRLHNALLDDRRHGGGLGVGAGVGGDHLLVVVSFHLHTLKN